MPAPRVGLVLSAGGLRGVYAHTGLLQAIQDMGIPIAAMAGCSAGAIVGGIYASGTKLNQWLSTLENLHIKDFWPKDALMHALWRLIRHGGHAFSGIADTATALAFCKRNIAVSTFEKCQIPFHTVATNLSTGEKACLRRAIWPWAW